MQRHRFYTPNLPASETVVALDGDEAHHLTRVLRLGPGARVFVFDGEGSEFECEVLSAGKRLVELKKLNALTDPVESPLELVLGQALVKGDKFDWIIQKTTELGVSRIVPLLTDHADVRWSPEKADQKLERWRRISIEAVKQSGRRRLVQIAAPVSLGEFCHERQWGLFFSERGGRSLDEMPSVFHALGVSSNGPIGVCIGPEGGWSEAEIKKAEEHGYFPVLLGSRILRTETAAITAIAITQHRFGDLV
jgi:16S rRNA (uracil1498-N3)-methyltransferase